ncbi:hypothetical protein [Streptomyces endocoffeicus]|nr:hypothetical protein [Streptomyces endocoffeicus]
MPAKRRCAGCAHHIDLYYLARIGPAVPDTGAQGTRYSGHGIALIDQ